MIPQKTHVEKVGSKIQTLVSPLNALYFFPLVLSAVLDFLSPFGNYLIIGAVLFVILLLVSIIAYKYKKPKWVTTTLVIYCVFGAFVLCSSALANLSYKDKGGVLAVHIPKVKTWQDNYLVSIKKDTESILAKSNAMDKKLDQSNFLLNQIMANIQAPLEKVLQDEVKSYSKLSRNQKDALVYFSSKVGTNGIKKYKKLLSSIEMYANNPTPEGKKQIIDRTKYIVSINGKKIEDEKTKLYVLALFFEPQTFDYLLANGGDMRPQENSEILKIFNINPELPANGQINDKLGDLINQLNLKGEKYNEIVIIPKEEAKTQSSNKSYSRYNVGI